jgi:hypothetical protein
MRFVVSTAEDKSDGVLVAERESRSELNPENFERLFDPFYDQSRWHGHGTIDLPFDRRSPRGV